MGEIFRVSQKLLPVLGVALFLSCSNSDEVPVADFDVASIQGEYAAQMKMDFAGPRPEVSVFGGSATVAFSGSDSFTISITFPDDYFTSNFSGTVSEKIVSGSNSNIGGISFLVEETSELTPNPDKIDIQTRSGEMKKAYAVFKESAGDNLIMILYMIEKEESPTEFEFKASKSL
jgi:hypothetical protein